MIFNICKWLCFIVAKIYFRFETVHAEKIPRKGGGILAVNHASFLDPPLAGIGLKRQIYFMARSTLMPNRFLKWYLHKLNCIPVNRERLELSTFRKIAERVKNGDVVTIFPEGTRSPDGRLQEGKEGTGMIVAHLQAPVYPCYISGASQAFPRGSKFPYPKKIRVIYGDPLRFNLDDFTGEKKEIYQSISNRIMAAIAQLKWELEGEKATK